jgi:general secretion pathway protein A
LYKAYFGLREKPFTIAPDPRYLYMSAQHQEALAHLLYGMNCDGGFVLLTGEVGTGKTTVCRRLLGELPKEADLAVIFNPRLSVVELLETVCDELLIPHPAQASVKTLVDLLNARLLETNAAGRKTVLIIDEAQSLSAEVLEQLRLLTNLETDSRKLLQIILLGQPELSAILSRPEMRQLAQRVTARYHLGPLTCEEVKVYVRHRLEVAGCDRPIFPPAALRKVCRASRGIPRLVNLICDRALLGAYTRNLGTVNRAIVRQAAREVLFETDTGFSRLIRVAGLVSLLLLAALAIGFGNARFGWLPGFDQSPSQPLASVEKTPVAPVPSPQAAAPPAQPVQIATLPGTWPSGFAVGRSSGEAFIDLAALWGVALPAGTRDPCRFVESAGLRCLSRQDSLVMLRKLNRPALLTLYDDNGKPFHVLLGGLDGKRARFVAGGEAHELDVAVLESRWFGEFQLLWKPPAFYASSAVPGSSGPAVPWLAGSLETLGLYTRNGREVRLDGQLLGALKRFQLAAGLVPDGLLGPMTLVHLRNALDHEGPLLTPVGESN